MAHSKPDTDVATKLAAAGLGTVGTDIFVGPEHQHSAQVPAAAIFCASYGAGESAPYMGQATGWREMRVQVTVRTTVDNWEAGRTKARQVIDALHAASVTDSANASTYPLVLCQQDEPTQVSPAPTELPRWTINMRLAQEF